MGAARTQTPPGPYLPLPLLIGCLVRDPNLPDPESGGTFVMMLASGQVCYGCSKAGTSPLWFGVTLTVRSDRPKCQNANVQHEATRATRRSSFLVTFGRRSSFYFLRCGGLERHAAKPHLTTSTTSSRFRAAFQRRRPEPDPACKAGTQPLWAPLIVGVSSAFAYSE